MTATKTEIRPHTERTRVRFSHPMTVRAEPERVFPLLCPVVELDWVPGWEPRLVYTESGIAERGCIFQTEKPGEGLDTWVVSHYEPPRRISFVRVDASRVVLYDIELRSVDDGTELRWRQEITALDQDGDRRVREMKADDFAAMIESLEAMAEHYLRTGEMLEAA